MNERASYITDKVSGIWNTSFDAVQNSLNSDLNHKKSCENGKSVKNMKIIEINNNKLLQFKHQKESIQSFAV